MQLENYKTACGGHISVTGRVQEHLLAHPDVIKHLAEAVSKIVLPRDRSKLECEVSMGRVIGRGGIVKICSLGTQDRTLFATRTNRKFPSHVSSPGAVGTESTTIVLIAKATYSVDQYQLITAWVGVRAPKEPWDPYIASQEEFDGCLQFWREHALVYDATVMTAFQEKSWAELLTSAEVEFSWN